MKNPKHSKQINGLITVIAVLFGIIVAMTVDIYKTHKENEEFDAAFIRLEGFKVIRAKVPASGLVFNVYAWKDRVYNEGDSILADYDELLDGLVITNTMNVETKTLTVLDSTTSELVRNED